MKIIKIIGLLCLFSFTFFYTDKVITTAKNQDEIMIKIKEYADTNNIKPKNANIENNTIIPGEKGKEVDINSSYISLKKLGYFEPNLIKYQDIYPEISIYNNYNKYIIKGNQNNKYISLIYILNNNKTIDNILYITEAYKTTINFFIDSSFLNNNIQIISLLNQHEIYNYGNNGKYTKDNLIISNNIINNKSNNKSIFCLFTKEDESSLNNCANSKMLSIMPNIEGNYNDIKVNLSNGSIVLINNTQELKNIIEYINSKGYKIVPLSQLIIE